MFWNLVNPGYGPVALNEGVGFNLNTYLSTLSQSFRFNVRKTDRYFQESTGPTLADDVGEAIALALDQASWGGKTLAEYVAAAPELGGTWANGTTLTFTTFTPSGLGFAGTKTSAAIAGATLPAMAVTVDEVYRVEIAVNSTSRAFDFRLALDASGAGTARSNLITIPLSASPTVVVGYIFPTLTGSFFPTINNQGANICSLDIAAVSIKKVVGYYARQTGASTLRPIRQAEGAKFDASDDNWLMAYLAGMTLGTELFPDSGMSDASTGWTYSNASGSIVSGALRLTSTAVGAAARTGYKTLSGLTIGVKYRVTVDVVGVGGTNGASATSLLQALTTGGAGVQNSESAAGTGTRSLVFTATATSHRIQARFDGSGGDATTYIDFDNLSVKELTSQSNFVFARTTVPASLGATQAIAGSSGPSAHRMFIGVNTSGFACGGVGDNSSTTIVGTTDLRSTEADIALTFDGTTVRLIVNGVVEYEGAQAGAPTTAIPFRIGALNNNGTGGSYYGGAVKDISGGTDYLDLAKFNQIRAAVAANQ